MSYRPRLTFRRRKWMIWIASLLGGTVLLCALRPAWTPSIAGEHAVATLNQQTLNGRAQWVLTRGHHQDLPVVLFLHGGPGMPAMYLAHIATRSLERDFVVVHWDRRDAGKSFDPTMPPEEEKVSVQLADAEQLVIRLRAQFGQRRLLLVGHSWGTYLGLLLAERHPDWFAGYVGMGQVTDQDQQRAVADRFLRSEAARRGRSDALAELQASPNEVREKWLFEFGAELYGETSFLPLVVAGLLAPEYSLRDTLGVAKGPQYAEKHMRYDVGSPSVAELVHTVSLPTFFLAGRFDYNTPSALARAYLSQLEAPCKELFWFERSAHFPFFEEPEKFAETMRKIRDLPCVAERL